MRAGEGLGEEQRGQQPQRYLAHYIDAHEHQRIHEHFAERGIGDDFAEIIQTDEGTQKLSQVAERDLLKTHRDVVENRKPDQCEQIEHRREQEHVQQRRSCVRHRDSAGRTDEVGPAFRFLQRGPLGFAVTAATAAWPGSAESSAPLPSTPAPQAWRR